MTAYLLFRVPALTVAASALELSKVTLGDIPTTVTSTGVLQSVNYYALSTTSGGTVHRILKSPGAKLSEGEAIIELLNPELERQLIEAEAALATEANQFVSVENQLLSQNEQIEHDLLMARSQLGSDRAELQALQQLIDIGAVAKLQYERQRAKVETLEVQLAGMVDRAKRVNSRVASIREGHTLALDQRRKVVDLLRKKYESLTVRAPGDSVLTSVAEGLREGLSVQPGQVVAEIARDDRLQARINVPASRASDISVGQRATIKAGRDQVDAVVQQVDPQVRRDEIEVVLAIHGVQPSSFRAGLTVTAEIATGLLEDVTFLTRPRAVSFSGPAEVWVMDGDQLVRRSVKFGAGGGGYIVVENGLSVGDVVVVDADPEWNDASSVKVHK